METFQSIVQLLGFCSFGLLLCLAGRVNRCHPTPEGRFTNRGFFIGPVCPIYGVGATLGTLAI